MGEVHSRELHREVVDTSLYPATTRAEVLATAGSRSTCSANPLAMRAADATGLQRVATVGMSCQASVDGSMQAPPAEPIEPVILEEIELGGLI